MKRLLLVLAFSCAAAFAQRAQQPSTSSGGASAAIACVGAPGNTPGAYQSLCDVPTTGALYACKNASGCTVAADWIGAIANTSPMVCNGTNCSVGANVLTQTTDNAVCVVSSTNTIASCITALASSGGTIYIPAGITATISSGLVLDTLSGITIEGANFATSGVPASVILYTGTTGPIISAKSTFGIHLVNLGIEWNNASFTGDIINTSHSGSADTSFLEIDHDYFAASGSGAAATNLLNLDDTVSSSVHDSWFCGPTSTAILGANTGSDYADGLTIGPNNVFNCGTGEIAASMIRNMTSAYIYGNTFEMSSGAGSPSVVDCSVNIVSTIDFTGNWVGDATSSYSGDFFHPVTCIAEKWNISDNQSISMSSSATGHILNLGTAGYGFTFSRNYASAPIVFYLNASVSGLIAQGNNFAGTTTTVVDVVSGTASGIDVSQNHYNSTPTNMLVGTIANGCVESSAWLSTCYGNSLALSAGATATTQSVGDSSSKVATDQFVLSNLASNTGGQLGYSGTPNVSATVYVPVIGSASASTTAANVGWPAPAAQAITGLQAYSSSVPGAGNTLVVTLYDGSTAEAVTCAITAAANTCSDTTHTFTPSVGDLLTWQITPTGTVTITPNIQISATWGTSPVQVTFFQSQCDIVTQAFGTAVTQNHTKLAAVFIPQPLVVSNIGYDVQTADNTSNSYDIGAFGPGCLNGASSIPLAFHSGTTAGTTLTPATGLKTVAITGAPVKLSPGWYCFAYTSSAASPAAVFGGSTSNYFFTPFNLTTQSVGGATLPSTITAPALNWSLTGELAIGLW